MNEEFQKLKEEYNKFNEENSYFESLDIVLTDFNFDIYDKEDILNFILEEIRYYVISTKMLLNGMINQEKVDELFIENFKNIFTIYKKLFLILLILTEIPFKTISYDNLKELYDKIKEYNCVEKIHKSIKEKEIKKDSE